MHPPLTKATYILARLPNLKDIRTQTGSSEFMELDSFYLLRAICEVPGRTSLELENNGSLGSLPYTSQFRKSGV